VNTHHPISGARLRKLLATTALSATALGLAAGPASADVGVGRQIEVFHGSNLVGLSGYPNGTRVEVLRGGQTIALKENAQNGGEGSIVLNHGPGECWDNSTPDMLPGDVVRATLPGAGGAVDTMTVAALHLDPPVANGNGVNISGSAPAAGEYGFRIVFDNRAVGRLDAGVDLPAGAFGGVGAEVTVPMSAAQAEEFADNGGEWGLEMIGGANNNELTLADEPATAAADQCPPLAQSAVLSAPASVLNGTPGQAATSISGIASTGVTANVRINGGAAIAKTGSWSHAISRDALNEGANTVSVSYTGVGAPTTTESFTITKDTIAPLQPSLTFDDAARSATLGTTEPGSAIRYTLDGTAPSATVGSVYALPINLPFGSTRIRAVQIDAAGNVSAERDVTKTYDAPVQNTNTNTTTNTDTNETQTQVQQPPAPQPQPQPQVVTPQPQTAPSVSVAAARTLRVTGSSSLRKVRRSGLRYSVRVSGATRFLLVRLVRVKGAKRTVVQERVVRVARAGLHNGTLRLPAGTKRGRYQLEVAPAGRDERYSSPIRTSVRIG